MSFQLISTCLIYAMPNYTVQKHIAQIILKITRVKISLWNAKIKPSLKCVRVCVDVFLKGIKGLVKVVSVLDLMERRDASILSKIQSSSSSFFNLDPNRQPEVQRKNSTLAPSQETCTTNRKAGLFEGWAAWRNSLAHWALATAQKPVRSAYLSNSI